MDTLAIAVHIVHSLNGDRIILEWLERW